LDALKKWFQTHIDFIMETYESPYHLQKEENFLVIGTLNAPNYALLVSHSHPEPNSQLRKMDNHGLRYSTGIRPRLSYDESIDIKVENRVGSYESLMSWRALEYCSFESFAVQA